MEKADPDLRGRRNYCVYAAGAAGVLKPELSSGFFNKKENPSLHNLQKWMIFYEYFIDETDFIWYNNIP